ncbi:hypothetical protein IM880_15590 [Pectobacterium polaris]|uniref:ATP-binding protein n=1 Tax=Pectobacterium polaris TaxID=2042057 RepID=A0AAW4P2D2_9GAMM|nr:antiviral RADAR system adenosine triphosphatase RdrA [Pectobacterium polaris]MBW5893639.1 hypothetical protein [Pectobacterium polaris]
MNTIYIPLDSGESAVLKDPDTLLPRNIYEQLARFIAKAVDDVPKLHETFNETRSHKAISIDGERGTGKTSVLVNLSDYLESNHTDFAGNIHILDPIDPTLLEDGESLFLHIIVAAVLQDKKIKEAQSKDLDKSRLFTQKLENLAHGLESVDLQQSQRGMDKIRSLYGSKHLANCVEEFLKSALDLIGKKLLILPIDDVDTSLNRAFENLEILRRYLTSPYVLPIVSGDRRLYDEVCWRDFHGRLNKDSSYERKKSYDIAKELAIEYQRKILPLPRRLSMPAVSDYWQQDGIDVTLNKDGIPLRNFMAWLKIFITGPVNGLEGSDLPLPIPSIRALTQFINHCGDLIIELPQELKHKDTPLAVRRWWQMPDVPRTVLEAFALKHRELSKEAKREYADAYKIFNEKYIAWNLQNSVLGMESKDNGKFFDDMNWINRLLSYFQFEPKAGAVYLTLEAQLNWAEWRNGKNRNNSIFDTALFQPLLQERPEYAIFNAGESLADWESQLSKSLPEGWLSVIKGKMTILPYPIAETGINSGLRWKYWEDVESNGANDELKDKAIFLISTLTQRNFYTNARQSIVLNIGRIFEIIIASLISDLDLSDLQRIIQRSPFYSASALAPTKKLQINEPEGEGSGGTADDLEKEEPYDQEDKLENSLKLLYEDIKIWREENNVERLKISPWMVYKVFNKVYSQVASNLIDQNGMQNISTAINIVGRIFYSTWSAFGSFEKGELFGLPDVVATTNINSLKNFYQHANFRANLGPFTPEQNLQQGPASRSALNRKVFGEMSRTASYVLSSHPLKRWIDVVLLADFKQPKKNHDVTKKITSQRKLSRARRFIIEKLDIDEAENLTKIIIKKRLTALYNSQKEAESFINLVIQQFSHSDHAVRILLDAYSELYSSGDK